MPQPFPHTYSATLKSPVSGEASIDANKNPTILGGAPPEFDGKDDVWSPEHLFLSAINLCQMNTMFALARRKGLAIQGYESSIDGVLDKTKEGLVFTSITIRAKVESDDDAKARELMAAAKKYCLISNALKVTPELELL